MDRSRSIAIVGGGIGGLTTAIALRRKGYEVTVYEAAESFKNVGAGIVLAGNAMKALQTIGIDREIIDAGRKLKRFAIRNPSGTYLSTTEADKINRKYGLVNTLSLHRAELHKILLSFIEPGIVHQSKTCTGFEQTDEGTRLFFADGTYSDVQFVIAADGIHSVFRKKFLPDSVLRYSGYTCWRAVIDVPGLNIDEATETWGRGKRFGVVPLTRNRIYWYATLDSKPAIQASPVSIEDLRNIYAGFHDPVPSILKMTREEQLIHGDISDFKPITQYAFGNIVLIGDAAHATTPNLGQGACMAIEDAVVLANALVAQGEPVPAFRLFEKLRLERNTRVVNASWSLGKLSQVSNPVLASLRNAAIRLTPESVAERQMKFLYDVSFTNA
jgi:2-polyprenyl-6-methoxyphenol hydroxylase-like FAD-dependent oxidoreductase